MNKVIVFAGTTEGREICSFLKKYTDNAILVFQEIIDKFPGTQKATKAEQQIEALGGTVKTEE